MQPLTYWEFMTRYVVKTVKLKLKHKKKPVEAVLIGNKTKINDVSIITVDVKRHDE